MAKAKNSTPVNTHQRKALTVRVWNNVLADSSSVLIVVPVIVIVAEADSVVPPDVVFADAVLTLLSASFRPSVIC